jgi:phosphodiesterase/alkaline phosphatase D-like protein
MASRLKAALCILSAVAGISQLAFAQSQVAETPRPPARIVAPVNDARLVLLRGNTRPETRLGTDLGSADPQLPMQRMLLILKRSPEQETALAEFNARQLDPGSSDFHHWLTPEEFGALYGPSDDDIGTVTSWLQNHGFTIDSVSKGRVFIEFSGTAGLVQQAFHSEIHRYNLHGEEHIANSADPSIPEALAPVVTGIFSLNNFYARPLHHEWGIFTRDSKTGKWMPENGDIVTRSLAGAPFASPVELVSPYDFATIYNVLPLWNAGIDGTGQTIAIAGRSNINLSDVARFRSAFGLPAKAPTVVVNGPDPGTPSADDKEENTLDVEWSGAVAKGATIKFVTTASSAGSDGAFSSAAYIIDNNIASIMSFSYGACELVLGATGNEAINRLWQQGATEGITIFVASGNQGSAACDGGGAQPNGASQGLAVNGASSTPYNVAVGGTDLNWINSSTSYWNASNAANGSSAKGYIPEVPWNTTCASDVVSELIGGTALGFDDEQTCQALLKNDLNLDLATVAGGTGGVSACTTPGGTTPATCTGGYAKPSWQTGAGVPADGKRDVPDLSLFASGGTLNSAYAICDSGKGRCTSGGANGILVNSVGGTSAASPAMAGIMALVNQKTGSAQGNANAAFYVLATRDARSKCNSVSVGAGNACNFYDITTGSIAVPCIPGNPNCTVRHAGDAVGFINGYRSTVAYDLATGLGSVNAGNLVNNWHLIADAAQLKPTATTGAASAITRTTATVAGSVNPNGADTHRVFAYGTSSTLVGAKKTASVDAGAGKSTVSFSVPLTGLIAGEKYYYQLQATNSGGTTNGAIKNFNTSAAIKPTATTGAASAITRTTATVAGTLNPNGSDTHRVFAYGTSSTLVGAKKTASVDAGSGTSTVSFSVPLTGLIAGTKYYYQVQATDKAGTTNGVIKSFTTSPAIKPTATTGAASAITKTTATVAASVNPSGADTHIVFAYGTSSTLAGAKKTTSVDEGSGATAVNVSANLTGLVAGTKYYFQLQATNKAGTTNGAIKSFTTTAGGTKPTATTGAASAITATGATIAGSVTPNGADTHIVFAYGTSSTLSGASKTTSLDVGSGTTSVGVSVQLNGLTAGTKYYYQMQATNSAGTTNGAINSFTTTAGGTRPTATTGAASAITATGATIAGSVTPNGADTHIVFAYGTSSTLSGASKTTSLDVGSGTTSVGVSVPLTGLTSGTKYYYQLQATNSAGTTNGAINSFTTTAGATKPTATTGAASSITATGATITGSVNPNGDDTHMFFAYGTSSTLSGASKTSTLDVGSGTTSVGVSVPLTGLTSGTKYYYQPQATNSAGTANGAINSFTTTGTTATKPTATTGAASLITASTTTVAGSVTPNGADTHYVFSYGTNSNLSGAKTTTSTDVGSGTTAVAVSAGLTGLTSNTKYYYRVQATNSAGTTDGAINSFTTIATGWSGQVQCVKTVTGPSYSNNETQTWTVAPGIPQAPTGQTLYPSQWTSTGSGSTASQTWVINGSGAGKITVFTNGVLNFARYTSEIVVPNGYQATPPPDYPDYEYQWPAFGNSDPNATHVQGSESTTSPACDSPVEPGGSSCTVKCNWDFNKQ